MINIKEITKNIIEIAEILDSSGKYEAAIELTKIASNISKNIKVSQVNLQKPQPVLMAQNAPPVMNQNENPAQKNARIQAINKAMQSGNLDEAMQYVTDSFARSEYTRLKNAESFFNSKVLPLKQNIYNAIYREIGAQQTSTNQNLQVQRTQALNVPTSPNVR